MSAEQVIEEVSADLRAGAVVVFLPASNGNPAENLKVITLNMLSATVTKVIPAHLPTEGYWKANPHLIVEGMIIGSYAIGACEAYIFVGDEFPQTVENARLAIEQAENMAFGQRYFGFRF